jgi:hypothetical protein
MPKYYINYYATNSSAIRSAFMRSTSVVNKAIVVVMPYVFLHNITFQQYCTSGIGILLLLVGRTRGSPPSPMSR